MTEEDKKSVTPDPIGSPKKPVEKPKRHGLFGTLTKKVTDLTGNLFDENIGSNDSEEDNNNA